MNPLIRFLNKLAILFGGGRFRRELDEEMGFHLAQLEKEWMAGGMPSEDAHCAAMRQFGNTEKLLSKVRRPWHFGPRRSRRTCASHCGNGRGIGDLRSLQS